MKYVIRVKPFDVLIKNRMANMTLVVCATRLVDEPQVRRGKGWHTADQRTINRRKLSTWKTVHKNIFKTEIFLSWPYKTLCKFHSLIHHSIFVLLLIFNP